MGKVAVWRILSLIIVLAGLYFLAGVFFAGRQAKPEPPAVKTEVVVPPPATSNQEARPEVLSGSQPARVEQLTLPDKPPAYQPAQAPDASVTLSQKAPPERQVLPGVTISRGQGVNIELAGEDERIQIRRDVTHSSGGYQVFWQKKY